MNVKKYRRCWNNHTVADEEGKTKCDHRINGMICGSPLNEHLYDTDHKGLVYVSGQGWGDAISIDWPKDETVSDETILRGQGHKKRIPHVDDYIQQKMKTGNDLICIITKVEPCGDPPDMFFFNCRPVNYLNKMKSFTPVYEKDIRKDLEINPF